MLLTALDSNAAKVLVALERVGIPLSGRAIARITGLTQSTGQRTLSELRQAGLVLAEPAPPALLYRINPDHLAFPGLQALLHLDDELRARLVERVGQWERPPDSVIVYGSVARGEATPSSDLDLLVVRPDRTPPTDPAWQRQLAALSDELQRWTGRHVSMIEMSRREATHGLAENETFLLEAEREGWLIAGRSLRKPSRRT